MPGFRGNYLMRKHFKEDISEECSDLCFRLLMFKWQLYNKKLSKIHHFQPSFEQENYVLYQANW